MSPNLIFGFSLVYEKVHDDDDGGYSANQKNEDQSCQTLNILGITGK